MNEEKITTSANKKLSPEEIKRVKGLGCLQDKRYDDIFNIRVITGNGHITTDEHRAIADAADKLGNGQITMTTRLSMEIQGVPYDNIEKTIAFLGENGLMTGGTGAKVRPVVLCCCFFVICFQTVSFTPWIATSTPRISSNTAKTSCKVFPKGSRPVVTSAFVSFVMVMPSAVKVTAIMNTIGIQSMQP